MAPNRKTVAGLVECISSNDLQNLLTTVQPKFLPLTDPKEQQEQVEYSEAKQVDPSPASYWDWQAPATQEPSIGVLHLSSIVSNLIQAAVSLAHTESHTNAENDEQWAEDNTDLVPTAPKKAQHIECSYWDWPAEQDSNKATIDRLLAEERAYELVSGKAIEAIEQAAEAPVAVQVDTSRVENDSYWAWESPQVAAHAMDVNHPSSNYWDWSATQKSPVEALLEYEAARQMLSTERLVEKLQSQILEAAAIQESTDGYWEWSDELGDQYWQAQQSRLAITTGRRYWD